MWRKLTLSRLSIRHRLVVLGVVSVLSTLVISSAGWISTHLLSSRLTEFGALSEVVDLQLQAQLHHVALRTTVLTAVYARSGKYGGGQQAMATSEGAIFDRILEIGGEYQKVMAEIAGLPVDTGRDGDVARIQATIARMVPLIDRYTASALQTARAVSANSPEETGLMSDFQVKFQEIEQAWNGVTEMVNASAKQVVAENQETISTTNALLIGVSLASVLAVFALVLISIRAVVGPLSAMTGVMAKLAGGDQEAQIPALDRSDEVGEMARSLTTIRDTGVRAARVQTALDNAASVTVIADLDNKITYTNKPARRYFSEAAADIRTVLPGFQVENLNGTDLACFFSDPLVLRTRLAGLMETREERLSLGGRTVAVTFNPVMGEGGNRLGTVAEWVDLTASLKAEADKVAADAARRAEEDERRLLEQRFQEELATFVEAAAAGDLSRRVDLTGRSGLMLQLGDGMNRLVGSIKAALDEIVVVNAALAAGDLTTRVTGNYSGEFKRLKDDTNVATIKTAEVVDKLVEGTATIKSATEQLTTGAKDLSSRTEEQVASLEEMAASIRQMSVTVKQNAENAQKANELALSARDSAEGGGVVAGQAVTAVQQIDESSAKISEIVGVMDEIAFQTNLLALNAAVEAARAGDAGRGFAVVAEEVRALAQRSSQASKEIKVLIAGSTAHVKRGVDLVGKAGAALSQIVTSVKRVSEFVSEIAAASQEQADGVRQVDETVTQLEGVTQKNASLVEESTASLNAVDRQVDEIMNVVSFFRVDESGARGLQSRLAERVDDRAVASSTAPNQKEGTAGPARWATGRWQGF